MVCHYLEIMGARLGERLRHRVELAPDCAALNVPPGLLITLVENAIEHGIEPALRGGEVQVRVRRVDGFCDVQVLDDGVGLAPGAMDGVGLTNTRERLHHAFCERAQLRLQQREDSAGTQVLMRWPVEDSPPG
jgi:LytS/YehU family sensor histidine kinase